MKTEIGIFNIGRTMVDREEVEKWLTFLGVSDDFELPDDGAVSDPALLIALAAKRCYKSFEVSAKLNPNITRVRTDYAEYLDNVMNSAHGSVLEHSVFTFALENVSRVFTAEMNRHRAGWAISEGSLRFISFGDCIPYWEPTSIRGEDVFDKVDVDDLVEKLIKDHNEPVPGTIEGKRQVTRELLAAAFKHQEAIYRAMSAVWNMKETDRNFKYKKTVTSMMRRHVGMGVATGGVWSGNVRALRHVMTMRCAPAAEEEILHVFSRVCKMMSEKEPMLFGDFTQNADGFWVPKYVKI